MTIQNAEKPTEALAASIGIDILQDFADINNLRFGGGRIKKGVYGIDFWLAGQTSADREIYHGEGPSLVHAFANARAKYLEHTKKQVEAKK